MTLHFLLVVLVACGAIAGTESLVAQATGPVQSNAARVAPTASAVRTQAAPRIDGRLDESAWESAQPITAFLQRDPDEGEPASQATAVRVLYDDDAIYIG